MEPQRPGQRMVVVDDERVIADTLALILNQSGWETTAVYSGQDAVQKAAELQPNVLITDVVMDGLNGIEAAILISQIVPGCRIILISGNPDTADLLDRSLENGHSFPIYAKPVSPRLILELLVSRESGTTCQVLTCESRDKN